MANRFRISIRIAPAHPRRIHHCSPSRHGIIIILITGIVLMVVGALPASGVNAAPPNDDSPGRHADDRVVERTPGERGDDDRKNPGADVYLNDSMEAADALRRADELMKKSRWHEAAELIHRVSEESGDKLTAVEPDRYTSVRAQAARIVASWPSRGKEAYRALGEPAISGAIRRLNDSRDYREYLRLFERYFATTTAGELAGTIGQMAIEAGDFALAEQVYRRVLSEHPDAQSHDGLKPRYQAMLEITLALQGKPRGAVSLEGMIRWMGQDKPAAEVVEAVRRAFGRANLAPDPNHWPTLGGDPARNRPVATSVDEPGLLWRAWFDGAEGDESQSPGEADFAAAQSPSGHPAVTFPAVSGNLVFAQRQREIVAFQANTGAVAWRFSVEPPEKEPDAFLDDRPPDAAALTVNGDRVFATLPAEEPLFYQYDLSRNGSELLALQASDGHVIWRVDAERLGMKKPELSFDTAPLVWQDSVYIVGRRRRTFGFEDAYLYQFNAKDGLPGFRVHLGSASTMTSGPRPSPVAALLNGTIFACSGLGSIVGVSAYTGEVRWATLYRRNRSESDTPATSPQAAAEVTLSPVLADEGRIIALPPDGADLLILRAEDGTLTARVAMNSQKPMDALLGVRNGVVCGIGDKLICYDLGRHEFVFQADMPPGAELTGMPVWSNDEILVPTDMGLSRYASADGARSDQRWDTRGKGGNILAFPDRLIVAEQNGMAAYVRRANIWKSLRARMNAAPTDPLPAVELAEVALNAGEYIEAGEVFKDAVRRLANQTDDALLRRRVFTGVLKLGSILAGRGEESPETFESLCSIAAGLADNTSANAEYRLRFGRLFEKIDAPAKALQLYQQILTDRSLRPIPSERWVRSEAGAAPGAQTAGAVAEQRIAALIAAHGRNLYAEFEKDAEWWLQRAVQSSDEQLFRQTIETYPNALAAGDAYAAYGDWLAGVGRHAEAWRLYALAYKRRPGNTQPADIAAKLAKSLVTIKKQSSALRWLQKAAHELPSAIANLDDRQVSLQELAARLANDHKIRVEPTLPRVVLPLSTKAQLLPVPPESSLLTPRLADDPGHVWNRFLVRTPQAVIAFDSATGERLWQHELAPKAEVDLLLARADLILLATLYETIVLDAATGRLQWSIGRRPEHLADPGADWEQGGAYRTHAVQDDLLISVRDDGRMTAVSVPTGSVRWRQEYKPAPFGKLRIIDPWVVYYIVEDGRAVLCILDTVTGAWSGSITTDESRPIEDLFVTIDGRAILLSSRAVSAYDLDSRTKAWEVVVSGQVRPDSLVLDWIGLYFFDAGFGLNKVRLDVGTLLWTSEPPRPADRTADDLTVHLAGETLLAGTSNSISGIDANTGLRLWEGTTPQRPRFEFRLPTEQYLVAIDSGGEIRDEPSMAYFYDHRSGRGLLAKAGGGLELGRFRFKRAMAVDGGLVLDTDQGLLMFTPEK